MSRKGKLTPHASRIHRMVCDGATALAIWQELRRLEVSVSYEGVRKWIKSNPIDGISLNGPGRPPSVESRRFDFLPAEIPIVGLPQTPVYLLPLVAILSATEEIRMEVTKRAFCMLGLAFDETLPRSEWIIPAQRLANISDLEYCLVAYLISNLPSPPLVGIAQQFEAWFGKLMVGAYRLKDAVKRGLDTTGKELFDDLNQMGLGN